MRAATYPQGAARLCRVVITMSDKSKGVHTHVYSSTWEAIEHAMDLFPEAVAITASWVPEAQVRGRCDALGVCQASAPPCAGCTGAAPLPRRTQAGRIPEPLSLRARAG
mgnify:CR=1 FL=1